MNKLLCFICSLIICSLLCSCQSNTNYNDKFTISANSTVYSVEPNSYIDIGNMNINNIDIVAYSEDSIFINEYCADTSAIIIHHINTKTGSDTIVGEIEWNAMYHYMYNVIDSRYFVIIPTTYESGLKSTLYIYDIQNNQFYIGDEFYPNNIVQYLTDINNKQLAYFYYENETCDWVIKKYNFEDKKSDIIYEYEVTEDEKYSPMSLCSNGDNLILALQAYDEEYNLSTKLKTISYEGEELKELSIPNFDIDEISVLKYLNGYYYFYGKTCSTIVDGAVTYNDYGMLSTIDDNYFITLSPQKALIAAPTNFINNPINDIKYSFFLAKKDTWNLDIVTVDTENHKLYYLYVNTPECFYVHSAKSNEHGDIAILKYGDEDYNSYVLALIDNETIISSIP